jgi:hypothetical protein
MRADDVLKHADFEVSEKCCWLHIYTDGWSGLPCFLSPQHEEVTVETELGSVIILTLWLG